MAERPALLTIAVEEMLPARGEPGRQRALVRGSVARPTIPLRAQAIRAGDAASNCGPSVVPCWGQMRTRGGCEARLGAPEYQSKTVTSMS